jgi:hypothetical protein
MKDYELKAENGKYAVNAPPIDMFAFGELVLDVRGPFFEHMATFMVAWAGLMSAFDDARYGNHMDSIAEIFAGKIMRELISPKAFALRARARSNESGLRYLFARCWP